MDWHDGVVYQIYPRSFQDSDGDGVGDLAGIASRLDHLRDLGVDALWLSPIYPSPLADFGYDVSDHADVDPVYGTLDDFDAFLSAAHERGLRVLMDLVACHTSIEHPWFREHPDWYVWSPVDGPPNDWVSAFGGPAWSRDERSGRWYLHSFYPEQPDLDWHNPQVVEAMQGVVRFWVDRGVDGFRIDAIDRLMKDPQLRDDPRSDEPFGLWLLEHELGRDFSHSRNWPEIGKALGAIREAAGDKLLVGEVYLPARRHAAYLEHLDRTFVFEMLQSSWEIEQVRAAVAGRQRGARCGMGPVESRLRPAAFARRPRTRAGGGDAPADPARHRVRVSGRRDRPRERPRPRSALRPRGTRLVSPSDAVGRDAGRRLQHQRAVASGSRSRRAERRRAVARPGVAALVLAVVDRAAAGAGRARSRWSTPAAATCWPSVADR